MWSNIRVLKSLNLLRRSQQFIQPKRTTFILKRTRPVRLNKLGDIFPKKLKRREYYYEVVENTDDTQKPPLEVVLTTDVAGLGMRGEKIEMDMFAAYRDLLLPKMGVLASSPEAQNIMKTGEEKQYSSIYAKIVENYLCSKPLKIVLSRDVQWTLKPWHVKVALRRMGISASEDCITIPKQISGPTTEIENKNFLVYVTMNKSEKFSVRCKISLQSTVDPSLNYKARPSKSRNEALFEDEKEIIDSIIKMQKQITGNKMIREGTYLQKNMK